MGEPRTLLCLDCATVTGCAEIDLETDAKPRFYSAQFANPGDEHTVAFARARRWIDDRLSLRDVAAIYLEAPLSPGQVNGQSNANTVLRLIGLWAVISSSASVWRVKYRDVDCQDARETFFGQRYLKGEIAKLRAFRMAERIGWTPKSHDEGDAAAILYRALTKEARDIAPKITDQMRAEIAERCDLEWLELERGKRERKFNKARRAA